MRKTILSLCMAAAVCHGSIDATTAERGDVSRMRFWGTSSCYIFIGYTVHTALPLAVFPHPYSQNRFL